MADIERVKRNISSMIEQNAPEGDIDLYVKSEGVTPEILRGERPDTLKNVAKGTVENILSNEQEIQNLGKMEQAGEITPIERNYRALGQVGKSMADVYGGAVDAADLSLGRVPSKSVKGIAGLIGKLPSFGGGTLGEELPKDIQSLSQGYQDLEEKYPRTMGVVGATGNIISATPLGAFSPSKKAGRDIYTSGVKKARKPIEKLVQEPLGVKAREYAQSQGRLDQKTFGQDVVKLSPTEDRAASLVENIKELKSPLVRTDAKKGIIIKKEAEKIATEVYDNLGKYNNYNFKPDYIEKNMVGAIRDKLYQQRELVKQNQIDLKGTYNEMLGALQDEISKNPLTLQGLLQARRDFNAFVQRKGGNLSPEAKGVANRVAREIGNDVNEFIAKHVPDEKVRERLLDSHALYVATQNITEKVAKQADSGVKRFVSKLEGNIPLRNDLARIAGFAGVSYAATQSLPITIGVGGAYVGGKLLNSAQSKKVIGFILDKGGDVLDGASRDALLEYMEYLQQQDEESLKMPAKDVMNMNKGTE